MGASGSPMLVHWRDCIAQASGCPREHGSHVGLIHGARADLAAGSGVRERQERDSATGERVLDGSAESDDRATFRGERTHPRKGGLLDDQGTIAPPKEVQEQDCSWLDAAGAEGGVQRAGCQAAGRPQGVQLARPLAAPLTDEHEA